MLIGHYRLVTFVGRKLPIMSDGLSEVSGALCEPEGRGELTYYVCPDGS